MSLLHSLAVMIIVLGIFKCSFGGQSSVQINLTFNRNTSRHIPFRLPVLFHTTECLSIAFQHAHRSPENIKCVSVDFEEPTFMFDSSVLLSAFCVTASPTSSSSGLMVERLEIRRSLCPVDDLAHRMESSCSMHSDPEQCFLHPPPPINTQPIGVIWWS